MKIKCENPVIIVNRYLAACVATHKTVYMNGDIWNFTLPIPSNRYRRHIDPRAIYSDFPYKWFSPSQTGVTPETIENYYVFDRETGETFPVYHLVPCNHCSLCREKRAKEWQARCLAETATSDYPPLFITLTYSPENRPYMEQEDGTLGVLPSLDKSDYQKFLKRLRIRLERAGLKHGDSLRYVLCGEYGKETKLPHYHLLLWNMPFIAGDGKRSSFEALHDVIRSAWNKGNVYIEKCIDGSGKYCLKYMRKGSNNPEGTLPCFFAASRRPGIGREWCDQQKEFYRANPQVATLNIFNKFADGKFSPINTTTVPQYFKSLWFPTLSRLLSKDVRDKVERYVQLARILVYAAYRLECPKECDDVADKECDVAAKFFFLPIDFQGWHPARNDRRHIASFAADVKWQRPHYTLRPEIYKTHFHHEIEEWSYLHEYLMNYKFDQDKTLKLLNLHAEHSAYLAQTASMFDFDVRDEIARVARANARLERSRRSDANL